MSQTSCGRNHARTIGHIELSEVSGRRVVVDRTPATVRRPDPGMLEIGMQILGLGIVRQAGREAALRPGDFALYDTRLPYQLEFPEAFTTFVVRFPRAELRVGDHEIAAGLARTIRFDQGIGGVVSPFLYGLRRGLADNELRDSARLESAVFDLVSAVVEGEYLGTRRHSGAVLLSSVRAFIEAQLSNIDLTTRMIADRHHISPRYLQRLFEEQGQTVAGWIRHRRLEKCRNDLADQRLVHLSIGAICSRYGLADPSHFSKIFKEEYGVPPREYRNLMARTATSPSSTHSTM
ncbi:helix-turn-helix domain-containing protein [Nocardia yunnanensis]|nr:helix-turn-helix domain-containing protein [Nocardia yunnanensis]